MESGYVGQAHVSEVLVCRRSCSTGRPWQARRMQQIGAGVGVYVPAAAAAADPSAVAGPSELALLLGRLSWHRWGSLDGEPARWDPIRFPKPPRQAPRRPKVMEAALALNCKLSGRSVSHRGESRWARARRVLGVGSWLAVKR